MTIKEVNVLVVDDSSTERLKVRGFLGKRGFIIHEADNGAKGVELFKILKPDLVLMDVLMPVMNGFEAVRAIRHYENNTYTPILMLTAADDMRSIELGFDAGANDFFLKPINFPLLQQRIRYALRDAEREKELRLEKARQDTAKSLAGLAFWEFDLRTQRFNWSDDVQDMVEWLTVLPQTFDDWEKLVHPEDRKRLKTIVDDAVRNREKFEVTTRIPYNSQTHILKIVGQRDEVSPKIIGAFQDITLSTQLEQRINFLSFHDSVTGLPNLQIFKRELEEYLVQEKEGGYLVVAVLEVLRLKQITEAYGTSASNNLLTLIANNLKNLLPKGTGLARIEGGDFLISLHVDLSINKSNLEEHVIELVAGLDKPWTLGDREIYLSYAIGLSHVSFTARDPDRLLKMAQRALRNQRIKGNISVALFQGNEDNTLQKRLKLESDLRHALQENQFYLMFQPQLDLSTDRIVGVEALVRWEHPEEGVIPPFIFIPVLEEMGLINELGDWILRKAMSTQVELAKKGHRIRMGINLSPAQFEQKNLIEKINTFTQEAQAEPRWIELEITESIAMHDPESTIATLQKLRRLGFKIAIDDFGIGFSSLEYLLRFPLDTLKIDRAFIMDITRGRSDRAIVHSLTSLCHGMGLTTIAEGVETQRQRDYIDALGATEIQGFLVSKPLKIDALLNFIEHYTKAHYDV